MKDHKMISYPCEGHSSCYELEDSSFWFRQRNRIIENMVEKYGKPGVFADVGGGNGYVASKLDQKFPSLDVVLIEPGLLGCQNARERGINKVFNTTLSEFNEYETLDNVGIFDVIEHIENDEKFLFEIYNKLTQGGKVFITVPAYSFLWSREDEYAQHFRRYTSCQLISLARTVGFKLKYSSYFFISLIPLIFLIRVLPEKLGYNKKRNFSSEHKENFASRLLEKILAAEFYLMKLGFKCPFGASLILVLEK
jgi:SAM-dependent methyltransferase